MSDLRSTIKNAFSPGKPASPVDLALAKRRGRPGTSLDDDTPVPAAVRAYAPREPAPGREVARTHAVNNADADAASNERLAALASHLGVVMKDNLRPGVPQVSHPASQLDDLATFLRGIGFSDMKKLAEGLFDAIQAEMTRQGIDKLSAHLVADAVHVWALGGVKPGEMP